jgi:hypothetical protein
VRRSWPWLWGSGVDVPREGGGDVRTGDWGGSEARCGGQRARGGWREPYEEKRGGQVWPVATQCKRGVVRAADSDATTVGTVTVRRARRCAAQKKRGKALGHPGKEKEGEGSTRAAQLRGHGARQ